MPIISTYYNQLWLIDYSNHLPNFHEWFLENNIEIFFHNTYIRLIILYFPLFQIEKCHWLPKWPNVLKVCEFRLVFFSTWPTALVIADKYLDSIHSNAYRNCDYETYRCFWTYETVPFEYIFYFIAINTLTNVYKISLYGYIQIFSGQPETSTLCMYLCLVTMCLSYVNNKKHIKKNLIKIRSLIHFLYFDLKKHSLRILPVELCFD